MASDSTNQPVWNSCSEAWKARSRTKKVRNSDMELTGPVSRMKSRMRLMFQWLGLSTNEGWTR